MRNIFSEWNWRWIKLKGKKKKKEERETCSWLNLLLFDCLVCQRNSCKQLITTNVRQQIVDTCFRVISNASVSKKLVQTIDNNKSSTTNCWYLFTSYLKCHYKLYRYFTFILKFSCRSEMAHFSLRLCELLTQFIDVYSVRNHCS
jgi:hypothetical protein